MNKSTILYLAAGAAAIYVLTRKTAHPVTQAADALTKAADASAKASDAAVTTAIAADKLASAAAGVATKGMGRRSSAKGAEIEAARILGIKNAMLANALAEERGQVAHGLSTGSKAFLEGLSINGKRVQYSDEPSVVTFANREKKGLESELEVPFSIWVGGKKSQNTPAAQSAFLTYLHNNAAGEVGASKMTRFRNSWSKAHYRETLPDWEGAGYSNSKTEPMFNQKPGPQLKKAAVNDFEKGAGKKSARRPVNLAD
jgi:hypothetical protein